MQVKNVDVVVLKLCFCLEMIKIGEFYVKRWVTKISTNSKLTL